MRNVAFRALIQAKTEKALGLSSEDPINSILHTTVQTPSMAVINRAGFDGKRVHLHGK